MQFIVILLLLNMLFGVILTIKSPRVNWKEFLITSICTWLLMLGVYSWWYHSKIKDYKFINDRVQVVKYEPEWVSLDTCSRTTCNGKTCHTTLYPCFHTHGDESSVYLERMKKMKHISNNEQQRLIKQCGPTISKQGKRYNFYSGDRNDYFWEVKSTEIIPWTELKSFRNKIAVSNNIIKRQLITKNKIVGYPDLQRNLNTNKVINIGISPDDIAKINSGLNKANIIVYGYDAKTKSICNDLKAKWVGGKSNDLIFCLGWDKNKIISANVFGWERNDVLKKELESLTINKNLTIFAEKRDIIIDKINKEYMENDMSEYNYLSIHISGWDYTLLLVCFLVFSIVGWLISLNNDIDDDDY